MCKDVSLIVLLTCKLADFIYGDCICSRIDSHEIYPECSKCKYIREQTCWQLIGRDQNSTLISKADIRADIRYLKEELVGSIHV